MKLPMQLVALRSVRRTVADHVTPPSWLVANLRAPAAAERPPAHLCAVEVEKVLDVRVEEFAVGTGNKANHELDHALDGGLPLKHDQDVVGKLLEVVQELFLVCRAVVLFEVHDNLRPVHAHVCQG